MSAELPSPNVSFPHAIVPGQPATVAVPAGETREKVGFAAIAVAAYYFVTYSAVGKYLLPGAPGFIVDRASLIFGVVAWGSVILSLMARPATLAAIPTSVYWVVGGLLTSGAITIVIADPMQGPVAAFYSLAGQTLSPILLAAFAVRNRRELRVVLLGLVLPAIISALVGLLALLGLLDVSVQSYGSIEKIGVSVHKSRMVGFHGDPNFFAGELHLPLFWLLSIRPTGKFGLKKAATWASAGLLSFGVLMSVSRGAWIAVGLGFLVWALWSGLEAGRRIQQILVATILGGALFLMVQEVTQVQEIFSMNEERMNLESPRSEYWKGWILYGMARPMFGSGPGSLGYWRDHGMYNLDGRPELSTHNMVVTYFLDIGLVGVSLLFALFAVSFGRIRRLWFRRRELAESVDEKAICAGLLAAFVSSLFLSVPMLGFQVALGVTLGQMFKEPEKRRRFAWQV
jgi:hypothetical protein